MADQIATITIPCLVIQLNNTQFIDYEDDLAVGKVLQVPCRNVLYDNTDGWAIPVKDNGVFTQFEMVNKAGDFLNKPTFDSLPVFRIEDKLSNNYWWIYGTKSNFLQSCATCCGIAPVPMPDIDNSLILRVAPCQELDDFCVDANNKRQAIFALPQLQAGQKYFPYGGYNNVQFPAASALGYNLAQLQTYLTTQCATIGSPSVSISWAFNGSTIIATVTGSSWGDNFCLLIAAITPSA